ncbi:hypothetical protein OPQ81_001890 [Rhizoctonia solani]|nr:hypothetical protein OPQ81_001890 [Rhizoctonia solani]
MTNHLASFTPRLSSVPHPISHPHPYFEAAESHNQCFISEQYEGCRLIVQAYLQLIIVLFILFALMFINVLARAVLFLLSWSQPSPEAREVHTQSRVAELNGATVPSTQTESVQPSDAAPLNTGDTSAAKRGKSDVVGEIALGSPPNAAQARAQSASGHVDTSTPLATHESQTDEILSNGITHPEGTTQSAPDSRRGSSNPLEQSPLVADGTWSFQADFYRFVGRLVGRLTATVVQHQFPHPLHVYEPILSIFAISGEGSERDVEALHCALQDPHLGNVLFASFSRDIALHDIDAEIKELHDECSAVPNTRLFIYLTSHGNMRNEMILSQCKTISEVYLFNLLSANGPTIPITILFDICRQAHIQSAVPPVGISLIWTCSLGQTAGACRAQDFDGPDSCFLNALMMTARTPNLQHTSETLKQTVQERLDQLTDYLKEVYVRRHPTGRCPRCFSAYGPCDKPERQNVDWGHAGDVDGLLELTKILSSSQIAERVYQRFMGDEIFITVNKLSGSRGLRSTDEGSELGLPLANLLSSTLALIHPPEDHTSKHARGANDPVCAG